jgi:hypothetical protein
LFFRTQRTAVRHFHVDRAIGFFFIELGYRFDASGGFALRAEDIEIPDVFLSE